MSLCVGGSQSSDSRSREEVGETKCQRASERFDWFATHTAGYRDNTHTGPVDPRRLSTVVEALRRVEASSDVKVRRGSGTHGVEELMERETNGRTDRGVERSRRAPSMQARRATRKAASRRWTPPRSMRCQLLIKGDECKLQWVWQETGENASEVIYREKDEEKLRGVKPDGAPAPPRKSPRCGPW